MGWFRLRLPPLIRLALLALLLATPVAAQPAGGTLRLLAHTAAGTLDPHLNYTAQYWQLYAFTYDGLSRSVKSPVPAAPTSSQTSPTRCPHPKTAACYTVFHLRPGLHFSDGRPVGPADVIASLRRIFRVRSPTAETFYGAIAGAPACLATPDTCTLDGVTADGDIISIRLSRPDPEFLAKLALPHASILPARQPGRRCRHHPDPRHRPLTASSPTTRTTAYRSSATNTSAPGTRTAQPPGEPDRIEYVFGLEDEAELTAIENDQADWMFERPTRRPPRATSAAASWTGCIWTRPRRSGSFP